MSFFIKFFFLKVIATLLRYAQEYKKLMVIRPFENASYISFLYFFFQTNYTFEAFANSVCV